MPEYTWKARSRDGKTRRGVLSGDNEALVRLQLRRMNLVPLSVKLKKVRAKNITLFQPRIKEKDIVVMTRQFATMIDAGLPVVQCLEILAEQQEKKNLGNIIRNVKESVEGGKTLSESLSTYPNIFSKLYVSLVEAGETGGVLDTVFNRLAAYIEKVAKLKAKVKGAMTYPAVVLAIAVLVVAVILIFVIPVFSEVFSEMGVALPLPTQIVVDLSYFFRDRIAYIVAALVLLILVFRKAYKTDLARRFLDRVSLRLPLFGMLLRKVAIAKFCRTLGTMVASGVPILESMDIVARTAGNKVVEGAVVKARTAISQGKTIVEPLRDSGVFPSMVTQMISVGEATGELDNMLAKIADFYDDEVDHTVESLTSMLEPAMMVVLGGIIGGMVISMYLPIFQMAGVLMGG